MVSCWFPLQYRLKSVPNFDIMIAFRSFLRRSNWATKTGRYGFVSNHVFLDVFFWGKPKEPKDHLGRPIWDKPISKCGPDLERPFQRRAECIQRRTRLKLFAATMVTTSRKSTRRFSILPGVAFCFLWGLPFTGGSHWGPPDSGNSLF